MAGSNAARRKSELIMPSNEGHRRQAKASLCRTPRNREAGVDIQIRLCLSTAILTIAITIAGCNTPFARDTRPNYDAQTNGATITISDPKLYRRESLINERRNEIAYLDDLLAKSTSIQFKPEIYRDLEVISAITAAFGASVDQGASREYQRSNETNDIQHQIDTLKLQLQLDQLRQDAQLIRSNFTNQTEPANKDLGIAGSAPATSSTSASAANTAAIGHAINTIETSLASRLDADAKPASKSQGEEDPSDLFRDREAYRDLIKSAKNAASLDELHDAEGSALMRLSFEATLFPPPTAYRDTLGMVRMQVEGPQWDHDALNDVYQTWLSYVNQNLNVQDSSTFDGKGTKKAPTFIEQETLSALPDAFFERIYYYYPQPGASPKDCSGLSVDQGESSLKCGRLTFAIGRLEAVPQFGGESLKVSEYYLPRTGLIAATTASQIANQRASLIEKKASLCSGPTGIDVKSWRSVNLSLAIAYHRKALVEADVQARKFLSDHDLRAAAPGGSSMIRTFSRSGDAAQDLLDVVPSILTSCASKEAAPVARTAIPLEFQRIVEAEHSISIYNVGPRERVQQMSTVSRAADAVSLAAAVSKSMPGSGANAGAALGYMRAASGKADALERIPLLVSFTEAYGIDAANGDAPRSTPDLPKAAGKPAAFGWIMSPSVSIDPSGSDLTLDHRLRPYDLSVDLSAPGWWPYMRLEVDTSWAPNWQKNPGKIESTGAPRRYLKVRLASNASDMDALTSLMSHASSLRLASILATEPATVSPCRAIDLQIIGENIWRTSDVSIGGFAIPEPDRYVPLAPLSASMDNSFAGALSGHVHATSRSRGAPDGAFWFPLTCETSRIGVLKGYR